MQGMRPQIERIAGWLVDGMQGKDEFDFIAEIAGPLPCLVIMALLGVPDGSRAEKNPLNLNRFVPAEGSPDLPRLSPAFATRRAA